MSSGPDPSREVFGLLGQLWVSRALIAAANLGVADCLGGEPREAREVADDLGLDADSLYRLLRGLAAHGIFREESGGRFTNNAASALLRADHPGGALHLTRSFGFRLFLKASVDLEHTIRTGRPALEKTHGRSSVFDVMTPEEGATYDTAMDAVTSSQAEAILEACDFSGVKLLADIGGGRGSLLASILRKNPAQRGVLLELPRAVADAGRTFSRYGVSARCEARAGDFLAEAPAGCDGYLLKNILHGWSDENCRKLLGNIRRVSKPGARIFVVEMIVGEPNTPDPGKDFDLFMLMGGHETRVRTLQELRALLESAGFALERATATRAGLSVIEGRAI